VCCGFFSLSLSLSLYPIPHNNTNTRTRDIYIYQKMASTMASTSSAFTVAPHRSSKTKRNLFSVRAMAGKAFEVPKKYTKVQPMGGRVLIKIAETEVQTKGGVLLTQGSQQKPTSGTFGDDFVSSSSFERERVRLFAAAVAREKIGFFFLLFSPYRLSFEEKLASFPTLISERAAADIFFSSLSLFKNSQVTLKRSRTTSTASSRAKPSYTTSSASVQTI